MAVCVFLSYPAFSQDAGPATNCPELSIIPRIDANPFSPYVYSLLDGSIGEHISYSFSNLWVSDDTPSLYANTLKTPEADWCQWAYVSLDFGNWHFSGGKQCVAVGSFECDEYDFDQYWQMCSTFWNNYQLYQYGGSVSYDTPSENTTFTLQLTSSPIFEHAFDNGAKTWSFKWTGEYGPYSAIWSANMMDYKEEPGCKDKMSMFILGNKLDLEENLSLGLDLYMFYGYPSRYAPGAGKSGERYYDNRSHSIVPFFKWQPFDWMDVTVKGIFEKSSGIEEDFFGIPEKYINGGVCLQFYPFSSLDGLRIHALAGKDNIEGAYWSAGITYNFNLTQTLFNRR